MRRPFISALAVLALACSCLSLPSFPPGTQTAGPATRLPPPSPTRPPPTPDAARGFTVVRVHPAGGDLNEQLAAEAATARAQGQDPYVEFDAAWCPCCQAIESSLNEGNALMLDAFQGVYVVRVDIDEWEGLLEGAGFEFDGIPIWFGLDEQGRSNGAVIDGNAWGENIPENMAPPLKAFFQSH